MPRVGVFGGSFDPVHDAHVEFAHRALDQVDCSEIWFLPAWQTLLKPAGPVAGDRHRVAMLEIALAEQARMTLCTLELEQGRPMASVETLQRLVLAYPDHEWRFLLGEDSFRQLSRWVRPAELAALAPLVVAPRPGAHGDHAGSFEGSRVTWLSGPPLDPGSTAIRAALAAGKDPRGLAPRVLDYIHEHGLYGTRPGGHD